VLCSTAHASDWRLNKLTFRVGRLAGQSVEQVVHEHPVPKLLVFQRNLAGSAVVLEGVDFD
jgi:hypothetical protein